MQISMRSWGSLTGTRSENQRTIDVFMPSYGATEGNYANWRHSSFACVRRGFERAEGEANGTERWVWRHDQSQKVMKVLRGFAGLEWVDENADVEPIESPDSYAILPRLGTVHGDDELPGGAGLGWSDRHDFLLSLGPHLEEIGLKPSGPMTRLDRRSLGSAVDDIFGNASRPKDPKAPKDPSPEATPEELAAHVQAQAKYHDKVAALPDKQHKFETGSAAKAVRRRRALHAALRALNGEDADTLEFFVLSADDGAQARVAAQLQVILGKPLAEDEDRLTWQDGNDRLQVILRSANPGALADQMEWRKLSEEQAAVLSENARKTREKAMREAYWQEVSRTMDGEVAALRGGRSAVACAILEMSEGLRNAPSRDPYTLSKRILASRGILVQPILVSTRQYEPGSYAEGKAKERDEAKYEMSVRDCLRMLGVSTLDDPAAASLAPAAICVIQKNQSRRGATFTREQAVPLAARTNQGVLEVALPDPRRGETEWMPYGRAVLKIMSGDYEPLGRGQTEDNRRLFDGFLAEALREINETGPSLVIAGMGGTTQWFEAIQNGRLEWDALTFGGTRFEPRMLDGLRLVRTNSVAAKLPQYMQEIDPDSEDPFRDWPSGLFLWSGGAPAGGGRTAFSLKKKPHTAQKAAQAMMVSRHVGEGSNQSHDDGARRASAQLEELCAVFTQPGDNPLELVDLADRWRDLHAAYGGATRLPYPLHELTLLEHAIVGDPE